MTLNSSLNQRRISTGNVMKYLLPGLENIIDIPFPACKLPVCKHCKQNFKSRKQCRVGYGHTDIPWNTTYLCVTLDDSCFGRDSHGGLCLVNESTMRFVAQSIPRPSMCYRAKEGHIDGKDPFCMACKGKNYTRHHCRGMEQHRQLPWGTFYILLSAIPRAPGDRVLVKGKDSLNKGSKRPASDTGCNRSLPSKKIKDNKYNANSVFEKEASDDIHQIEYSRTFLLKIKNDQSCVLRWLEIDPPVDRSENASLREYECVDQSSMHYYASQLFSNN